VGAGATTNQYEILLRLASGGMAEIFIARARTFGDLERYVVLKRVLPERSRDPEFVRMFLDEARLAAQLHHPNIAQVYDIGRLASGYFFTMEYVHGHDAAQLATRVRALRRQIPIGHVLTIVAGAAAGLHHAHERRGSDQQPLDVVHRDVTPSNLMVSFEGGVKLVDFGIAKASHRATETRAGTIKGKIEYLSPEQCSSNQVDRRSDVFSLGIVMWELLTGERLFRRETDFLTMNAIVNDDAPPPSRVRADIPADLDRVVSTALARDPAGRFSSAGAMLDELETVAARHQISISTAALGRYLRELFGERPEPWIEHTTDRRIPSTIVTATVDRSQVDGGPAPEDSAQIENALAAIAVITAPIVPVAPQPVAPAIPVAPRRRSSLAWMAISFVVTLVIGSVIYLATRRGDDRNVSMSIDAAVVSIDASTAATSPPLDAVVLSIDAATIESTPPIDAGDTRPDAAPVDAGTRRKPPRPKPIDAIHKVTPSSQSDPCEVDPMSCQR
jgi:serine/threonine protein kinase